MNLSDSRRARSPLVSIIMPIYNVEAYVGKSIRSILAQTYSNYELIAVDDGSSDASLDVARLAMHDDGRCCLIHQKNKGVSAARNRALSAIRGEYVMFVDPDDWIAPNALEQLVDAALENNADVVISKASFVCDGGERAQGGFEAIDFSSISDLGPVEAGSDLYLWNYFLSRDLIGSIQFDESISVLEDVDFIYRVCRRGAVYAFLNKVTYFYLAERPGSALTELSVKGCQDTVRVRKRILLSEMYDGRPNHSLDAYAVSSFGLLRRVARNKSAYYSTCREKNDIRKILTHSKGIKALFYRWAVNNPKLMRPCFLLFGLVSRRTKRS